jgi:5-methylcytosine-specific restriction endonuclease McrA
MHRHLKHLSKEEQEFIDLVYIQTKTFKEVAEKLNIPYARVQQLNIELDETWRPIAKIKSKWKTKETKDLKENSDEYIKSNFWDFYDWLKTTPEECHYCGITPTKLDQLHLLKIVNKQPTRGRTLEIDRKRPDEKYSDLSNLTYACYWCNNAKTDTFTEEEFMIIGAAIAIVWKKRLGK